MPWHRGIVRDGHWYSGLSRSKTHRHRHGDAAVKLAAEAAVKLAAETAVKRAAETAAKQPAQVTAARASNISIEPAARAGKWRSNIIRNSSAVLRERNFRRFYTGYVTSLLGTSMSTVAITWAVLDNGGSPTALGLVFAARPIRPP